MLQNIHTALSSVQDVHINQTDDLFWKKAFRRHHINHHSSSHRHPPPSSAFLRLPTERCLISPSYLHHTEDSSASRSCDSYQYSQPASGPTWQQCRGKCWWSGESHRTTLFIANEWALPSIKPSSTGSFCSAAVEKKWSLKELWGSERGGSGRRRTVRIMSVNRLPACGEVLFLVLGEGRSCPPPHRESSELWARPTARSGLPPDGACNQTGSGSGVPPLWRKWSHWATQVGQRWRRSITNQDLRQLINRRRESKKNPHGNAASGTALQVAHFQVIHRRADAQTSACTAVWEGGRVLPLAFSGGVPPAHVFDLLSLPFVASAQGCLCLPAARSSSSGAAGSAATATTQPIWGHVIWVTWGDYWR